LAKENHFIYMLLALLIFLIVLPIADDFRTLSYGVLQGLGFSCLFLVGIWSLRNSGVWFKVGLTLVTAGTVLNIIAIRSGERFDLIAALIALMLYLGLAIWTALRQILFSTAISLNRLTGAICVYLLLGTIWALAYSLVELASPGSFSGIDVPLSHRWDMDWLYFSFTTLTTLGFGDITPLSNTARVLVYAQAIVGVFYMAMLVASLVSVHLAERTDAKRPKP
jgi:hypothetical protein